MTKTKNCATCWVLKAFHNLYKNNNTYTGGLWNTRTLTDDNDHLGTYFTEIAWRKVKRGNTSILSVKAWHVCTDDILSEILIALLSFLYCTRERITFELKNGYLFKNYYYIISVTVIYHDDTVLKIMFGHCDLNTTTTECITLPTTCRRSSE